MCDLKKPNIPIWYYINGRLSVIAYGKLADKFNDYYNTLNFLINTSNTKSFNLNRNIIEMLIIYEQDRDKISS